MALVATPVVAFDHSHAAWDALLRQHVEKILTRYPDIRSIWDFGKFFGNPFRDEFFSLLGRKASLDTIEHDILRKQAVRFLSDRSRNRYRDGRLEVSRIFDWFGADFEPREAWLLRYAAQLGVPPGLSASSPPKLVFLDYDWSLNDSRSSSPR